MNLKQSEVELLLQNFFIEKNITFEGSYAANEDGQPITRINAFSEKGPFIMKLDKDFNLYSQNAKRTAWIKIDKY